MNKRKRRILFIQIAGSTVGILLEILVFIRIIDQLGPKEPIQNVFDEMIAYDARALRNSENICNFTDHRPHENYMRMQYSV